MNVFFNSRDFYQKLLILKKRHQLSKGKFCDRIGVKNAFVVYDPSKPDPRTNKIRTPSVETLFRIADEFKVEIAWLLNLQHDEPACFQDPDPEKARYLDMARRILESGTSTAEVLKSNIREFGKLIGPSEEEPPSNLKETNPIARRGRKAAGGV